MIPLILYLIPLTLILSPLSAGLPDRTGAPLSRLAQRLVPAPPGEASQTGPDGSPAKPFFWEAQQAEEICGWMAHYGRTVVTSALQRTGSLAWRFSNQSSLPYGLTREAMFRAGAPRRPVPLLYLRYRGGNFALLTNFESGYRIQYRPDGTFRVDAQVIYWLEPVQQIPEGLLPLLSETLPRQDCQRQPILGRP